MSTEREKDPRRVEAGQRLQRWLKEKMGAAGYADWQRNAARASNAVQLAKYGPEGYRQQRQAAYQAMLERHGPAAARAILDRAHDERRRYRLANPTPGEAGMSSAWMALGGVVHEPMGGFNYIGWLAEDYGSDYGADEAIREAQIGPYFVDFLLPAHRVVIEVHGGIHCICAERDAARTAWIEEAGLKVHVIAEADAIQADRAEVFIRQILD